MAPGQFQDRARALEASGVVLDSGLAEGWVAEWTRLPPAVRVVALDAPCPRPPRARSPRLATAEKDERKAAIDATRATVRLAQDLGAPTVIVRLGALDVGSAWTKVVRDFARRNLTRAQVDLLASDRLKWAARALDLARYGLEPVLEEAGGAGVTLALSNRARWFEIPDTIELGVLFEDFRGAPLASWYDAGAGHAREALGFERASDWLAFHGKRAAGAFFSDACGLRAGLPWGRGEVDTALVETSLPEHVPQVVHATGDVSDDELRAALG
jgi:hypothetical protein